MKRYTVVGLGVSGLSAVTYLYSLGQSVAVTDENASPPLASQLPQSVSTAFGGINQDLLLSADVIVISPGINPLHSSIVLARQQGIPIISDVQLFIDECQKRQIDIVAITGSNAKSTVTTLVGDMAKQAGVCVGVGGNIGIPALELLKSPITLAVLELSSFQLESITSLNAKVATILNLSADHLDRHGDMAGYLTAKLRIFQQAKRAVLYADDKHLHQACLSVLADKNAVITVTASPPSAGQFGLIHQDNMPTLAKAECDGTIISLLGSDELPIKGVHNLTNALFALAIGEQAGLPMASMIETLKQFLGLPHRCQFVAKVGVTDYFNDSKGTNMGATISAIQGLGAVYGAQSLVIILGGQAKGQAFGELAFDIARYGHTVLTIGEDAQKITNELTAAGLKIPIIACQTLETAVKKAYDCHAPAVLLSPACASFDQFTGFVQRGERFVSLVREFVDGF